MNAVQVTCSALHIGYASVKYSIWAVRS